MEHARKKYEVSERHACRLLGQWRRTQRYTAIQRIDEEALTEATIALADAISIPVIASGGLASIEDVRAMLTPRAKKLEGAIAGRALYDGRLDPAAALALIRSARASV